MATMDDLDALAMALPETTRSVSEDGRPEYQVRGKTYCRHREQRRDAVDAATGERLADVLMVRVPELEVKDALLADPRRVFFTTDHFAGYPAVLLRIPSLALLDRAELADLVEDAWLSRAPLRLARTWLAQG